MTADDVLALKEASMAAMNAHLAASAAGGDAATAAAAAKADEEAAAALDEPADVDVDDDEIQTLATDAAASGKRKRGVKS